MNKSILRTLIIFFIFVMPVYANQIVENNDQSIFNLDFKIHLSNGEIYTPSITLYENKEASISQSQDESNVPIYLSVKVNKLEQKGTLKILIKLSETINGQVNNLVDGNMSVRLNQTASMEKSDKKGKTVKIEVIAKPINREVVAAN
ncbi:MAG: hypothetical protein OEY19_12670 [Gammaproteobacteria bacterium]|nr:hypothetical protein [Gammaproteobacteria bacterium]MDH5631080.1 hypothetical protein [Gammaproteobacteria bacterium]